MKKLRMYETQILGAESCIHPDMSSIISEMTHVLSEMAKGDSYVITVVEMTQDEYDCLEEFDGY